MVVLGDTLVAMWQAPAIPSRQRWLNARIDALAATSPDLVLMLVILPSSDPPGSESRALLQEELVKLDKKLRKLIAVAIGDSLRMSIVRTIGRSMLFLIGKSHQLVLVGNMSEATDALRQIASERTPPGPALLDAVSSLAVALGEDPTRLVRA